MTYFLLHLQLLKGRANIRGGGFLGMLLSATAFDSKNGLFPIAFAIVEGES